MWYFIISLKHIHLVLEFSRWERVSIGAGFVSVCQVLTEYSVCIKESFFSHQSNLEVESKCPNDNCKFKRHILNISILRRRETSFIILSRLAGQKDLR